MLDTALSASLQITAHSHLVRFYEQEDLLLAEVYTFLRQAVEGGGTAVLIATAEHADVLARQLRGLTIETNTLQRIEPVIVLDAAETLTKLLVDGSLDRDRFKSVVGEIIARAEAQGGPVHVFGEMVPLLCAEKKYDGALYLERLWSELTAERQFSFFCAYPAKVFASSAQILAFQQMRNAHDPSRFGAHIPAHTNADDVRLLVTSLQQRALALEAEVNSRQQVEIELRRREWELHDFVENASEGLHRVDGDGIILWANRAELDLLGYTPETYIGRHIEDFHADESVIASILQSLSAGATLRDQPARLRCADGSIKHVLINSNGCFENGKLLYTRCFTRDATDRVARQQAQDQLRDTLINAPVATALLVAPDHTFRIANRRFCAVVDSEQLAGQRFSEALPAWHRSGLTQALDHVLASGQAFAVDEYAVKLSAGDEVEEHFFKVNLEPLRGFDGMAEGVIVSLVDLTQQVRDRQRLQSTLTERSELLAQLEEANRAKDEFLAMLGHELRNPLAPIVTALQLMRMRGNTGTEREQEVIQRQVDHLVQLIADLLDISKVTRGNIQLTKEWISLADVLTKAVEMASPLFEQRSHRLTVDTEPQLFVNGDPLRLAQVVSNLLSNAARYTPIGGEIHLSARRDASNHIEISVRDNGIGITAEMLPKVFDLFFQAARDGGRSDGGLGIGLALVKSFVGLHGGTASVRSAGPGCGSEFTVRLPSAMGGLPPAPVSTIAASDGASDRADTPIRILLVDDNVDAAETLARVLITVGHEVQVFNSPTAALAHSYFLEPDLAILDIGLPVMDGYELAARLRQQLRWHHCVFVALTGYGQDVDRERSQEAAFREHFLKPIDPHALLSFIAGSCVAKKSEVRTI